MSVSEWVPNFARRLAQLDHISGLGDLNNIEVWLGGLFYPEAYITATRQAVAHRKKWSLETLHLQLDLEKVNDPEAFILDGGASMIGASNVCSLRFYFRFGARRRFLGDGQARTQPGRVCAAQPITDPMGAVERRLQGISQPSGVPERRSERRLVYCGSSFRWQRWFLGCDQGSLPDGLAAIMR